VELNHHVLLILLIGSGISQPSGIASWNKIIDVIKQYLIESGEITSPSDLDMYQAPDAYFGKCSKKNEFHDFLIETVDFGFKPNQLHEILAKIPFKSILTTNWDTLIEKELLKSQKINTIYNDFTATRWKETMAKQVIKFHGTVDVPESVIFGLGSFENFYTKSSTLMDLLRTIFATRPILFLGFGMGDSFFKTLLSSITKHNEQYIVISDKQIAKKEELKRQNLTVIVSKTDNSDPYGMYGFLRELWENTYVTGRNRIERTKLLIRETKRLKTYLGSDKTIRVRASLGPLAVPANNDLNVFGCSEVYKHEKELLETVIDVLNTNNGRKMKIICCPLDGGEHALKKGYSKEAYKERLQSMLHWIEHLGEKIEVVFTNRPSDINDWMVSKLAIIESRKSNTKESRLYEYGQLNFNANTVLEHIERFDEEFNNLVATFGGIDNAKKEFITKARERIG
jgi:hypothetical protein